MPAQERRAQTTPLHILHVGVVDGPGVHIALQGAAPGRRVRVHVAASHFLASAGLAALTLPSPSVAGPTRFVPRRSAYLNGRTVPEEVVYVQRRQEQGRCAVHLVASVMG
jgi:hypothetical protein